MEMFSALLALCAGNSPVTGEFPAQRPVTRSFDVFFDLRLNKRFSKQSRGRWFETPSRSLWRQCNVIQQCGNGKQRHHGVTLELVPYKSNHQAEYGLISRVHSRTIFFLLFDCKIQCMYSTSNTRQQKLNTSNNYTCRKILTDKTCTGDG